MHTRSARVVLLVPAALSVFYLSSSNWVFAQGVKIGSSYDSIEKHDRDRPERRAEWMRRGRSAPAGQSAAALRLRAHQQKMTMRAKNPKLASSERARAWGTATGTAGSVTGWVALGPAPLVSDQNYFGMVSGRATAVAIDPSDTTGNTVYAAGAYGGVWKSINAAAVPVTNVVWAPVTDQQASLANGAVSVKSDGSVVLVGTGEPDNAIDSYYGVGILRSTDKGAHWTLVSAADGGAHPFAGLGVAKFAWASNTNTVIAATATTAKGYDEGNITGSTNRGLYLSNDGGLTWAYQTPSDGSSAIAPISATDVVYDSSANKFLASIRYHGLYSSANGTTWTRMASQPALLSAANCPATGNSTTCPLYRGQLAVVPGRDEVYFWFVAIDSLGNMVDEGIWRSIHGGAWTQISESGLTNCGDGYGCGVVQSYYNLTIAAIPDGSSETDLYAGTINLYKCVLPTNSTSCVTVDNNLAPNSWLNLTHVYGTCSDIAMVHPDQHGMDFIVAGGKALMYFVNDGGIYRALDGYMGLNIGSCNTAGSNQFDNLNATLGSLTQFVSFSVHPSDQKTLLGGTQDNGSPATTNATVSTQFFTANGGDGGYNAIDAANNLWYTANTDVSVQVCNTPPSCSSTSFSPVVSAGSATIGGDYGAFYSPYILDPQTANELLVGTCRVWRGSTAGTAFSALGPNFDTGAVASCTGGEINQIRSIAAGGPTDSNGFSKVVYATSDGSGPNAGQGGGEVWVTTNASITAMANVTGGINPQNYTISSVAMDASDTAGQTAYVGIMGFVGSSSAHVYKTTNAGQTWTAFGNVSAGLPDAPVNSLLVDSAAGLIYAGTDVGVFVSATSSAAWSEVGPPPGSNGYLPNVPVSAIRMFNSGGVQKLRVSTYGRGLWEYSLTAVPDFANVVSTPEQTVFPTQTATFNGTLTAEAGYNSPVNLSCGGTPPSTCTPNPAQVTPTSGGAAYTVSASGAIGDYTFTAHAVGTDANTITHDAVLTLHIVDFAVGAVNPNPVSVTQGTSATFTFQVSASGSFGLPVVLSCSGLSSGAMCGFSPSSTINPTAGSPVTVIATVSTSASTPVGSSTVTIQAATSAPATTKTATFTLTVTAPADFSWTVTGSTSHTVLAGQTTPAYSFTAAPSGSSTFGAAVTFSCSGLPDSTATCVFNPNSIAAGTGATSVSMTITTKGPNTGTGVAARGASQFSVLGSQKKPRAISKSENRPLLWTLPLVGGLVLGIAMRKKSPVALAMCVSLMAIGMMVACQSVSGNSSPPPPALTVTPSSASVPLGGTKQFSASQAVTWSVSGSGLLGTVDGSGLYTAPTSGSTPAYPVITAISQTDTTQSKTAQVTIPAVGVSVSPTPVSLYPNVSGANGWPTQAQQFAAAVGNTGNTSVDWAVSSGGGTIDGNGVYTAPANVPNPSAVTVTATSQADSAKSGTATVNVLTPTTLGTFTVTVRATEGSVSRSQAVTVTVE